MNYKTTLAYLALWLAGSGLLAFLSMSYLSATLVDGVYIPAGNDAFYHGRRILDAAIGERGFYQFDHMIHVPEGSWLTWPWGYDYLMAQALKLALLVNPAMEPMKFLVYVPVFWSLVNTGLFVGIARAVGLPLSLTAVATLAFTISGMSLYLHAVGNIDHHFIELTFVLATVLSGLRFFREDSGRGTAILLGVVLGIAPAFHNSLFILQVPLVLACGLLWLKGNPPGREKATFLAVSLFLSCLLFVLPSETFRNFRFEYATHSWFHLYVAACSSATVLTFAYVRYSVKALALAVAAGALLVFPLIVEISYGMSFLGGQTIRLDSIAEVNSPFELYSRFGRSDEVTRHYSWLIVLTPLLIGFYGWRAATRRSAQQVFFACVVVFGLVLLLAQFRLHVFGFWALIISPLVLLYDFVAKRHLAVAAVAALGVVAIAFQPTLRNQHFQVPPPGLMKDYAATRALYRVLADACEQRPGVVLSYGDEGHPVRYHTDCSVIANNFLLTPLHGQKVLESYRLLDMTPEQLLESGAAVDYVFVRLKGVFFESPEGLEPTPVHEIAAYNSALFMHLVIRKELPPEFELLQEIRLDDERDIPLALLFRVVRDRS